MKRSATVFGPCLVSGLILSVIAMTTAAAYASLLYRGPASPYAGAGFTAMMLGTAAAAIFAVLKSKQAGIVSGPDETAAISLSGLITGMGPVLFRPGISPEAAAVSVLILSSCASAVSAAVFWFAARYRLGKYVGMIPKSAVQGFVAGAGFLLLFAGLGLASGVEDLGLSTWPRFALLAGRWPLWAPAVLTAIALYLVPRRVRHPLAVPAVLATATILFFAIAWTVGHSAAALRNAGWLFAPPVDGSTIAAARMLHGFADQRWTGLAALLPRIVVVAAVELISVLLQISAMREVAGREIDADAELRTQSLANLAGAAVGSAPQVPFISETMLNLRIAGPNRLSSVVLAAGCVAGAVLGMRVMPWIPVFVLAAVLLYFGIGLVADAAWKPSVLLVAVAVNVLGFLPGLACGVMLGLAAGYTRPGICKRRIASLNWRTPAPSFAYRA